MNKEEALKLLDLILATCKDLTEKDAKLLLPSASKIQSHGYQLEIKSKAAKANLKCIKEIAEKDNLAMADKTQEGSVIIYRPCFINYSTGNLN